VEWVETSAKTVEQAKELALDQLHVDEADAEFEVLEEPRQGLFGRVRGEARVRARVRPVQPRPKVDRRDRRRSGSRRTRDDARGSAGGTTTTTDGSSRSATQGEAAASGEGSQKGPSRRRSRSTGRGGGSTAAGPRPGEQTTTDATASGSESAAVNDTIDAGDVNAAEQGAIVQEFLEGLLDAFGHDGEVTIVEIDDETVEVNVTGDDLGLLVGPRGNTIQSIHELSRSVVQRRASGTHHGRVRLDIAGYREKRRAALERFTQKLAQQAIDSGVAQVLEPMSAADRKVVHDTANDIEGVHTVSEGEDQRRHVVIVPDQA
jgi:spoIIIJ-associated protein